MDRLAELRERRALTLRELAEMSGVAADTINQIELGHRKARPSTLRKLARALDIEVREFFEEPTLSGKVEAPTPGLAASNEEKPPPVTTGLGALVARAELGDVEARVARILWAVSKGELTPEEGYEQMLQLIA